MPTTLKTTPKNNKKKNSKSLALLKINGETFSIRATVHALVRMKQRKVNDYVVAGTILSLGKRRLLEYRKAERDLAIINEEQKVAVIVAFKNHRIMIETVIDKSDIYVKEGTSIYRIGEKI